MPTRSEILQRPGVIAGARLGDSRARERRQVQDRVTRAVVQVE